MNQHVDPTKAWKRRDPLVRMWAIAQHLDPSILKTIVLSDKEFAVRLEAVDAIADQPLLIDLIDSDIPVDRCVANDVFIVEHEMLEQLFDNVPLDSILKRRLLSHVTDPALLRRVAETIDDNDFQIAAVKRIRNDGELIKLMDADVNAAVHLVAIEQLQKHDALKQVADGAFPIEVRRLALRRITDQDFLLAAALRSDENTLRLAAAEGIEGTSHLAALVERCDHEDVVLAALKHVDDDDFLFSVAMGSSAIPIRLAAIERIRRTDLLTRIVCECDDPGVVAAALPEVTDPEALASIAKVARLNAKDAKALVDRIDNPRSLESICSGSGSDPGIRDYAHWQLDSKILYRLTQIGDVADIRQIVELVNDGWSVSATLPIDESPLANDTEDERPRGQVIRYKVYGAKRLPDSFDGASVLHVTLDRAGWRYSAMADLLQSVSKPSRLISSIESHLDTVHAIEKASYDPFNTRTEEELNARVEDAKRAAEASRRKKEVEEKARAARQDEAHIDACIDLFQSLLQAGADPNYQDAQGASPLHFAMQMDQDRIPERLLVTGFICALLKHGARTDAKDREGRSVTDVAIEAGWAPEEASRVLQEST